MISKKNILCVKFVVIFKCFFFNDVYLIEIKRLFLFAGENSSAAPTSDGKYVPPSRRGNAAPSANFSGRSHRGKCIHKLSIGLILHMSLS